MPSRDVDIALSSMWNRHRLDDNLCKLYADRASEGRAWPYCTYLNTGNAREEYAKTGDVATSYELCELQLDFWAKTRIQAGDLSSKFVDFVEENPMVIDKKKNDPQILRVDYISDQPFEEGPEEFRWMVVISVLHTRKTVFKTKP